MGGALASHPHIVTQIEAQPAFGLAVEMAWDPAIERTQMPELLRVYEETHAQIRPRHFADKSHPVLWLAEALADHFPEAHFVAIRRRVLPTVASMLNHASVRRHFERWNANPAPNRFLGVTDVATYAALPDEARCALRAITSSREIDRLAGQSRCRIHVIEYEEMQADPGAAAREMATFLGVPNLFLPPMARPRSLERWRTQLSPSQIEVVTAFAEGLGASERL